MILKNDAKHPNFFHFTFLILLLVAGSATAGESYFITIQKLELKKDTGEWVNIIEPDHKVDLVSTEAVVSFFNNGRVPPGRFNNFKITFEDHGLVRQLSRKQDVTAPFTVKNGSFVNVSFMLDLEKKRGRVKELRLVVDDDVRVDSDDAIGNTMG